MSTGHCDAHVGKVEVGAVNKNVVHRGKCLNDCRSVNRMERATMVEMPLFCAECREVRCAVYTFMRTDKRFIISYWFPIELDGASI